MVRPLNKANTKARSSKWRKEEHVHVENDDSDFDDADVVNDENDVEERDGSEENDREVSKTMNE